MSGSWTTPDRDPRSYGDPIGELATYREYLTNYRLTLQMKCEGLDAAQLATRSVPPSTLSLLGLVRHMAAVEHNWFQRALQNKLNEPRLYNKLNEPDADFDGAVADQAVVDEAFASLHEQITLADEWLTTITHADLSEHRPLPNGDGTASIRDVLLHMVEEYARHAGHADLLREAVDGRTGL